MPAYAWSLIFLGYLVILLAHEAGHLLVARWYGYPVTRLSIGFGPDILRHTDRHGTCWALAILPLGAYVKIQTDRALYAEAQESLIWKTALGRRAAIWVAGPLANLALGFGIYCFTLAVFGHAGLAPSLDYDLPASIASSLVGLSLAVAIFNLLPIPPLDGGMLALIGIEAVMHKPLSEASQKRFRTLGLASVIGGSFLSLIYLSASLAFWL